MGAKQSKRSVDISAGTTKAEKVPAGEPLENGTITAASGDEKPAVEANGVEETPKQNGSTPHVDEKETVESTPAVETVTEPAKPEEEKTEAAVVEANGDLDTTADESVKSPTEESGTTEESSEKKTKKKKKSWSFRSISFSKKDKSKPTVKEQSADVKAETVPEVAEEEAVKEEAKPESEAVVDTPKTVEEPAVEEKESAAELNTTNVTEIPPPLPSSPPPVEEVAASVPPTPTIVETPAPVQPAEPEVVVAQPEQEDEIVGGGEGLAEPPEGLNTSDIEKEVAEVPLVNGNHAEEEKSELSSPNVDCLSEKIEAIKLSNTADVSEVINEISNNSYEVNGVSDAVAITNGDGGHGEDN